MTELASAYITLIPSLKGASASINSQLGGVDVSGAGKKIGSSLGSSATQAFKASGLTKLQNEVASATARVGQAMSKEKATANQLAIANQKLVEVKKKHADGSSQVMQAEERVRLAEEKHVLASNNLKSAQSQLASSQAKLKTAEAGVSAQNERLAATSQHAGNQVEQMGVKTHKTSGLMAGLKRVGFAALAAVGSIGIGVASLIPEAARASDAMSKFKKTLDFAGLDTATIEALAKSTRKYADQTIYDLSDIQGITAQLAANGVKDYDRLAEACGNLNAVAGGTKESFKTVGLVLTQTNGIGKLTAENWHQLSEAIPGASGMLKKAMLENGAYTGAFEKAMERGEITAEEFNEALMSLGFDEAAIEAAKSTDTFEGAFANLKSNIITNLADMLDQAKPYLTGFINDVNETITPVMETMSERFGVWLEEFKGSETFASLQTGLQGIQGIFQTLAPYITTYITPALQVMKTAWDELQAAIQPIMPLFQGIATFLGGVLAAAFYIVVAAITVFLKVGAKIAKLVGSVISWFQNLDGSLTTLGNFFSTIWATISATVAAEFAAVRDSISNGLNAIRTWWTNIWSNISSFVSNIWAGIRGLISGAINAVRNFIFGGLNAIRSAWSGGWSNVRSIVSNAWSAVKSVVSGGVSSVIGFVRSIPSRILSIFSNAGSLLKNSGRAIVQGLASGIKHATSIATGAVSGLLDKVRAFLPFSPAKVGPFSGHGWTLYSGRSIVEALAEGMVSRSGMLANATSGLMGMAHDTLSPAYSMPSTVSTSRPTSAAYEVRKLREELGGIIYNNTPVESDRSFARRVRAYA